MPEVSCYSMDLYCDQRNSQHSYDDFPHTFTGRTRWQCVVAARRVGWRFHQNGCVSCPKCKELNPPKEQEQ